MFCPKCGEKVLDGAEFCQKCGAKLIKDASAQSATSNPASLVQPIGKTPAVVQKKKKSETIKSPDESHIYMNSWGGK